MMPGVSEGVLPPNAEPVTSQEALHHLAKMVCAQNQGMVTPIYAIYTYLELQPRDSLPIGEGESGTLAYRRLL